MERTTLHLDYKKNILFQKENNNENKQKYKGIMGTPAPGLCFIGYKDKPWKSGLSAG